MFLHHQKTLQFMWKSHKKGSAISATLFAAALLFSAGLHAGEMCLYAPSGASKVARVAAKVQKDGVANYLLKDGSYLQSVSWACSRVGKRFFLVVPKPSDSPAQVVRTLSSIIPKDLHQWLKDSILSSRGRESHQAKADVQGYEVVSLSVNRDLYSSIYVVEYYTPD